MTGWTYARTAVFLVRLCALGLLAHALVMSLLALPALLMAGRLAWIGTLVFAGEIVAAVLLWLAAWPLARLIAGDLDR